MVKVHSTDASGKKKVHLFKYVFKAIDFCEHVNLRGGNAIIVSNTNSKPMRKKGKRKKKMSIKSLRAHAKRCGCVVKKKKRTKRRYKRRY